MNSEIIDNDGSHGWSIGWYLRTTYAKNSSFKLGLLCENEDTADVTHVFDPCSRGGAIKKPKSVR